MATNATLRAGIRRGFLRQIAESAKPATIPIIEALATFQTGVFGESFKTGQVYISTSGSGQSASFVSVPGFILGSQGEVFAMAEEFIALWQAVAADNPTWSDDGSPANTDLFLNAMLNDNSMQSVRIAQNDWTTLGWPMTNAT